MPKVKAHLKNQLRIIGGKWRSRKISFADALQLRPTPDRIRETLFNWLMPVIQGSHCLDVFAGSGALSFEALSRGATRAVLIDQSPKVISHLKTVAEQLSTTQAMQFIQAQIPATISELSGQQFDVVFLDPPFHQNLVYECCLWLEREKLIKKDTLIYIESESDLTLILPEHWTVIKNKKAGQVCYYLCKCVVASEEVG